MTRSTLLGYLFHLVAVLDLVDKNLRRLEARDKMLVDHDGSVTRNIPRNFLLPLLVNEAAKSTDVDVLSTCHVLFDNGKECLNRSRHIGLIDPGFFSNLVDDVCLGHGEKFGEKE